jgi:hypothetical protein
MSPQWTPLGGVAPTDLTTPRRQLHRAVQVVGATANSLLPAAPDHSHASLSWLAPQHLLATQALPGSTATRVALAPATLELAVVTDGRPSTSFELNGACIDDGYRWVERELHRVGVLRDGTPITPSGLDLGDGPGSASTPFTSADRNAFEELARWFGNASAALEELRRRHPRASAVRCWPHHFDIAVLIPLDEHEGENARSVGVGMTPGDDGCAEPYFYVTPWPYPPATVELPALPAGSWHTEGWTGAVLTGTEIVAEPTDRQATLVARYLQDAVVHSTALLDR